LQDGWKNMRRAVFPALPVLLVFMVLSSSIPTAYSGSTSIKESYFHLVAVEKGRGEVMNAAVKVYLNGTGKAEITSCCRIARDTLSSLRVALIDAGLLLGIDPWTINVRVVINTSARKLEGPSAGAAFALAILQALLSMKTRSYVATGQITPELLIMPVGGIDEKHDAAYRERLLFIYPAGNALSNRSLALPAASLPQAYRALINSTAPPLLPSSIPPSPYSKLFEGEARRLMENTSAVNSSLMEEAREAYREKYYYAAASLAFRANVEQAWRNVESKVGSSRNPGKAARRIIGEASRIVSEAEKTVDSASPRGFQSFILLSEASYRLYEAEDSLHEAEALVSENPLEAAKQAVYAELRARTAILWASLSSNVSGPSIRQDLAASVAYNYSSIIYGYADSVAADFNQTTWLKEYRDSLRRMYEALSKAYSEKRYVEAYGLSLGLLEKASTLLDLSMAPANRSASYLNALWEIYSVLGGTLASLGRLPASSTLYGEYAWFLRGNSTEALGILLSAVDRLVLERLVSMRIIASAPTPLTTTTPIQASASAPKGGSPAAEVLVYGALIVALSSLILGAALLAGAFRKTGKNSRAGS